MIHEPTESDKFFLPGKKLRFVKYTVGNYVRHWYEIEYFYKPWFSFGILKKLFPGEWLPYNGKPWRELQFETKQDINLFLDKLTITKTIEDA